MSGDEKGLMVSYEEYLNMHFCIGEIVDCTEVKNSMKLLNFKVRIGERIIQVISGLKGYDEVWAMVGKRVLVLTNLKPITMGGVTSEGVILSAEDREGHLSLIVPEKTIEVGAEVC